MFYQKRCSTLSFVKNKLTCNQNLIFLQSSNSNVFVGICIANKNPCPNLMNIKFGVFLTKYKSTYFIAKDLKMLNILSVFSSCSL